MIHALPLSSAALASRNRRAGTETCRAPRVEVTTGLADPKILDEFSATRKLWPKVVDKSFHEKASVKHGFDFVFP